MTAAAELLTEYRSQHEHWLATGEDQSRARDAYHRYFRQACAEGRPPDGLGRFVGTEEERFFDQIVAGPDGHNYWDGPKMFRRDNGSTRQPRYWWYEHLHDSVQRGSLKPFCSESHCITPTHQQFVSWAEMKRSYTDQQLIGALQVVVMRLGHSPTVREYDTERGRGPTGTIIQHRLGGWPSALRAAGYEPGRSTVHAWTREQCIEGIEYVAGLLGHTPGDREYRLYAEQLKEQGLPVGTASVRKYLGAATWAEATRKAGL